MRRRAAWSRCRRCARAGSLRIRILVAHHHDHPARHHDHRDAHHDDDGSQHHDHRRIGGTEPPVTDALRTQLLAVGAALHNCGVGLHGPRAWGDLLRLRRGDEDVLGRLRARAELVVDAGAGREPRRRSLPGRVHALGRRLDRAAHRPRRRGRHAVPDHPTRRRARRVELGTGVLPSLVLTHRRDSGSGRPHSLRRSRMERRPRRASAHWGGGPTRLGTPPRLPTNSSWLIRYSAVTGLVGAVAPWWRQETPRREEGNMGSDARRRAARRVAPVPPPHAGFGPVDVDRPVAGDAAARGHLGPSLRRREALDGPDQGRCRRRLGRSPSR